MIVVDTSVILASIFGEPGAEVFLSMSDPCALSSVNLAEVVTKLSERGHSRDMIDSVAAMLLPSCVDLTRKQSLEAGLLRPATRHLGLSLGDRCCLALALDLGAEVWTCERSWTQLDVGVGITVIR